MSRLVFLRAMTVAAGIALFVWLYIESSGVKLDEQIQIRSELRYLRQMDTMLDKYVLQSRFGQLKNYDALVGEQQQINFVLTQLRESSPALFGGNEELALAYTRYLLVQHDKDALLEQFKAHNSLLRSALPYFPSSVEKLVKKYPQLEPAIEKLKEVRRDVLMYNLNSDSALRQRLDEKLGILRDEKNRYAIAYQHDLEDFIKHAETVLSYKDKVDGLVQRILDAPTASSNDELFGLHNNALSVAEKRARWYRFWLALLASLAVAYGGYTLVRLNIMRNALAASQEMFRMSAERLNLALEGSELALWDWNLVTGEIYLSEHWAEMLGRHVQVTHTTITELTELIHPDDREMMHEAVVKVLQGISQSYQVEHRVLRSDGSWLWVSSHGKVVTRDENGQPQRMTGTNADIMLYKQAEEAVGRARDEAEAASRVKSDFIANISHEIRTPMNGIIGMTELTLDTELSREQRDYLMLVKSSAASLLTVINDVLDFSKIEAGHLTIEQVEFSMEQVLSQAMKSLALSAQRKGLDLLLRVDRRIPERVVGDPGRVNQVLVNLLGNAIKFTERGEIELAVKECETQSESGVCLNFSVRDTGIGIPQDRQGAIFESFTQADTSTTRKYGGTGLGLSISKRLVELMGGRIWLNSSLGQGSTFSFTAQFGPVSDKPMLLDQGSGKLRGRTVLVADDNAIQREILVELLSHWQMRTTAIADGEAALLELERAVEAGEPYDVLLLDARMQGDIVKQVRQHPDFVEAIVMLLTQDGEPVVSGGDPDRSIFVNLAKPILPSELNHAIVEGLGLRRHTIIHNRQTSMIKKSTRKLHLLLAEDNAVNQKLAQRLLEKMGHRVTVANNGRLALEQWQQHPFDVILMDVDMPEMNGYEATAAIRDQERGSGRHIPILAMTAHAMQGSRETCLAAGMDGYLAKPIDIQALGRELEKISPSLIRQNEAEEQAVFSVINMDEAYIQAGRDPDLFAELVQLFLADCPRHQAELHAAHAAADTDQVRRAAHALKGMCMVFAAQRAIDAAYQVELVAGESACAEAVDKLDRELSAIVRELTLYVAA